MSHQPLDASNRLTFLKRPLSVKFLLLLLAASLAVGGCRQEENPAAPDSRFKFVERVDFNGREAHIVLDAQTDVKYLYIWDGGSNGGPAITRLWEK